MAKTNNLTDFLTDVADAIREKEGSSAPINPQDFSAKIRAIQGGGESGGGGASASAGAVNFRDYDGTILHAFSKDEFLALTEMPELPTQKGLTCQGWNWNIDDAKAYVQEYGLLEVGATYITDDGKTRLYITIAAEGRMTIPVRIKQSKANGVIIDWGDGSATETFTSTSATTKSHTYSEIGDYVITFEVVNGTLSFAGSSSYGVIANTMLVYANMLQRVEVGNNVTTIDSYAFCKCHSLSSIVIPNSVTSIATYAFNECYSLFSIVIPNSVTSIGKNAFEKCYSFSFIVIPNGVTSIGDSAFSACYALSSIVIPNGVTSIGKSAFSACYSLSSVIIPNSVTSIGTYAFQNCVPLSSIVIPNGVTSIATYAFSKCHSLSSVIIPNSVTSIATYAFIECYSLSSIVIPNSVTSIGKNAFEKCYSLSLVVIPNSVTSIESKAFYGCKSLAILDFSDCTSVPALSNYDAFSSAASDTKYVVPDTLYDEWIAATNWSSYASKIVKASEFNG